jgi:hypothetical protein
LLVLAVREQVEQEHLEPRAASLTYKHQQEVLAQPRQVAQVVLAQLLLEAKVAMELTHLHQTVVTEQQTTLQELLSLVAAAVVVLVVVVVSV